MREFAVNHPWMTLILGLVALGTISNIFGKPQPAPGATQTGALPGAPFSAHTLALLGPAPMRPRPRRYYGRMPGPTRKAGFLGVPPTTTPPPPPNFGQAYPFGAGA